VALPGCSISVGLDGPQAFVRLVGRAAAESAPAFEKLVVRLKDQGVRCVVLDLSATLLMDSGFSGTLSRLVGLVGSVGTTFAIYQAPQRILDGLDDHGVLAQVTLLAVDQQTSLIPETTEVALQPSSKSEILKCCLDAHRALMALKPENVAKFEAVEQFLSRESARLERDVPQTESSL
jgi:anti-anti-sigma regulatory factor